MCIRDRCRNEQPAENHGGAHARAAAAWGWLVPCRQCQRCGSHQYPRIARIADRRIVDWSLRTRDIVASDPS
eukprot:468422-Alexandrium_andersonii.AAC.1